MTTTTTRSNASSANPHTVDDEQERFDRFIPIGKRRYGVLPNEKTSACHFPNFWQGCICENFDGCIDQVNQEIEKNQNFCKWLKSLSGPSSNYRSNEKSRWFTCQCVTKFILVLGTLAFLAVLIYVLVFMNRLGADESKSEM